MALRAATFQVKLSPFFSLLSPSYYFNLKFFVVLAPKNTFSRWNFSGFVFTVEWPRLTSPLKNGGRRKSAKIDETRIKRDSVKAFQLQDRSNMEVMCSEGSCCKTTAICRLRHLSKLISTKCTLSLNELIYINAYLLYIQMFDFFITNNNTNIPNLLLLSYKHKC